MKTYCVFHKVDLDGMSSAAVVKHFIWDVIFKPYNYNDPFPFEVGELLPEDKVFFVDVSIQPYTEMLRIYELIGNNLHIMDHHKSFLESEAGLELKEKLGKNFNCDTKKAGCELTWEFFEEITNHPRCMPKAIKLLGQYDAWRDTSTKQLPYDIAWSTVLAFQMGMRQTKFNTTDFITNYILTGRNTDKTIEAGLVILKYQDNQNNLSMNSSFLAIIKGFKCLVLNTGSRNSQTFISKWNTNEYDFMVAFSMTKERKWAWSFYTDKEGFDASALAAQFGGGGHVGASGCTTDYLIFT